MIFTFNNAKVTNPVRILFLCGSFFEKEAFHIHREGTSYELIDKRKVLKDYVSETFPDLNIYSIILEENFMFSNKNQYLNYNDIDLKSLKSIELLTSMYSSKVIILHESFSTAAEVGMFSTSSLSSEKVLILSPDNFSVEEEFISGFMNFAYQNKFYAKNNIKVLKYYPGVYKHHISDSRYKLHTFFVNNKIPNQLAVSLKKELIFEAYDRYKLFKTEHSVSADKKTVNIEIFIETHQLFAYLISLFNIKEIRDNFRTKLVISEMKRNTTTNRRKALINKNKDLLYNYLIDGFISTFRTNNIDIDKDAESYKIKHIHVNFLAEDINIKHSISYFIYIAIALGFINIREANSVLSISENFQKIYPLYSGLIEMTSEKINVWDV